MSSQLLNNEIDDEKKGNVETSTMSSQLLNNNINTSNLKITDINIDDIIIPMKTYYRPRHTKSIVSSELIWGQIEGVPCKITKIINLKEKDGQMIILNSFSSSDNKTNFIIYNEDLKYFNKGKIKDGYIMNLSKYPSNKLSLKEFDIRDEIVPLVNEFKDLIKNNQILVKIVNDKLNQLRVSQGSNNVIKIEEFKSYIDGTDISNNKLKRIGDPIFNRTNRWCPPIKLEYDEFVKTNSYPAPLGIRPKDYALPSTVKESIIEMLKQIYLFQNIERTDKLNELFNVNNNTEHHKCKWCNEYIDANSYTSMYSSADNFIEICHRDPNGSFEPNNMYWGHGSCNREQGGYSENERINQVIRLLKNNKEIYNDLINRLFN
jgi:hypothetical protein